MRLGSRDTIDQVILLADLEPATANVGDIESLVDAAHAAGADGVSFRLGPAASIFAGGEFPDGTEDGAWVDRDAFASAAERARSLGLIVVATAAVACDVPELLADGGVDAWRVDAADADFGILLDAVGATGQPVLLDVAEPDEVRVGAAVARVRTARTAERGAEPGDDPEPSSVAVLRRPVDGAADDTLALSEVLLLATEGDAAGFVDRPTREDDVTAAVAAAAIGADLMVRPLRADSGDAFVAWVRAVRRVESMLVTGGGDGASDSGGTAPSDAAGTSALTASATMHRVIVAAHDLAAGDLLSFDDIDWRRAVDGWVFGDEPLIVGRRLARAVVAGEPLREDAFVPRAGR